MPSKTPKKTSKASNAKPPISSKSSKLFKIDGYPITDIWEFGPVMSEQKEDQAFQTLVLNVVTVVCVVVMLIQIRLSHPQLKNEVVDRFPSFKFFKNRFITSDLGKQLAVAIGLRYTFHFEKVDSVEFLIGSYVDSLTSAYRRLDKVTENNYGEYLKGLSSRIIGLLQSCPATNLKMFNLLGIEVGSLTVADVIDLCGANDIEGVSITPQDIIDNIRNNALINSGGFVIKSLEFAEPNSSSVIENLIFTEDEIIRSGETPSSSQKSQSPQISDESMQEYLTKAQYLRFRTAVNSNSQNIIKDYYDIVKKKMNESKTPQKEEPTKVPSDAAPGTEQSQTN